MEDLQKIALENEKKILSLLLSGQKEWSELLNETKLSKKSLSKHIKRLLDSELISDEIDKKDRRKKIYKITEKGVKYLKEAERKETEEVLTKIEELESKLPVLDDEKRRRIKELVEELRGLLK